MSSIVIRPVEAGDRAKWEPLWAGYIAFYEKTVPAEATEFTWTRLIAGDEIRGFIAIDENGDALGLVQYFFHQSTWSMGGNCYLQDLFVIPEARGKRIGRRLIAAVTEASKKHGAAVLYWQTEEFNGTARRLYERVAKRAPFIRYQIDL
ncbi:GNAT family N-acetyltransferase [Terrarubrum flagellatum]|uniref:GNAT family N-acetyltransferase n=1 Tax=Terrirubrum flagellatum TaxID=2895980 RepID=UPI0031452F6B